MTAAGRDRQHAIHSVLGNYLDVAGPMQFWTSLQAMSDVAFFDTRVLMARRGWPRAQTRFAIDLLRPDWIADAYWRDFTAAARNSGLPLVLGGHSVVSGGLLALLEYWQE